MTIDKKQKLLALASRLCVHPRLPLALALIAMVIMLPALKAGLFADDLIQRLAQYPAEALPPLILETGFVPKNSGTLGSVANNLFRYLGTDESLARAKEYGIAPWWAHEGWRAALWRPLTAFTHWLDYRLFPNSPALMHAHNNAWFAAAVFLAATAYRRIASAAGAGQLRATGIRPPSDLIIAGLAAVLFLLDKNSYGPVMYVANRGFIIALVFGLACFHLHVQWRLNKSRAGMWLSGLCLFLSLLANEGGASTLAFLIAYALVLEPGGWRSRICSLIPAAVSLLVWRTIYAGSNFGVRNVVAYIDPGYAPILFLQHVLPRMNALLGGQLTGLPPELALALGPKWQIILALCFTGFCLACAVAFLPTLRQNVVARFWGAMMLLALVPAATVVPLSKNLGFVAVGAFGLTASFLVQFFARQSRAALGAPLRVLSWCVAAWLLVTHLPATVAARVGLAAASPYIPELMANACTLGGSMQIGGRDLVVVNDPILVPAMVPFHRAYYGEPLPHAVRVLVPGLDRFEIERTSASTLVISTKANDLFDCPALGPVHGAYGCKALNDFLFGNRIWKQGDLVTRKNLIAEVLEVGATGRPRKVAFRFTEALESENLVWFYFDWREQAHLPFVLPQVGEVVEIRGPRGRKNKAALTP